MKIKLACLILAAGFLGLSADTASAIDGPLGCYGGWGYGYLYNNLDYKIPYHAAYPPVYYSYPVPRTYGYSPFAYPPGTMTPDIIIDAPVTPATIINPYVQEQESDKTEQKDTLTAAERGSEPLVILNPHMQASKAVVKVNRRAKSK